VLKVEFWEGKPLDIKGSVILSYVELDPLVFDWIENAILEGESSLVGVGS